MHSRETSGLSSAGNVKGTEDKGRLNGTKDNYRDIDTNAMCDLRLGLGREQVFSCPYKGH